MMRQMSRKLQPVSSLPKCQGTLRRSVPAPRPTSAEERPNKSKEPREHFFFFAQSTIRRRFGMPPNFSDRNLLYYISQLQLAPSDSTGQVRRNATAICNIVYILFSLLEATPGMWRTHLALFASMSYFKVQLLAVLVQIT